jgi:hypothetical protein
LANAFCWTRFRERALEAALGDATRSRRTLAGYSGTPLPRKLGIKENATLAVLRAPAQFDLALGPLPDGVRRRASLRGAPADVIVYFSRERARLAADFADLRRGMAPNGALWVAWPKKASGEATDLDENGVRALGLANRLVDVKVCAIDLVWSGLKFVVRRADRTSP